MVDEKKQEVLLGEIAGTLRGIKGWVTFFGIGIIFVIIMSVLGLVGGCLMGVGALAGTGSIVASFKSPVMNVRGIDFHDGYLYHSAPPTIIYKTTRAGSVVQTIRADLTREGFDRTNNEFWTTGRSGIFKLSTTGSWIGTISIPEAGRGVAYGGDYLWLAGARIYKLKLGGSVVTSFRVGTVNPRGICYRNQYLWIVDSNIGAIAHATTTGSLIESYSTPQDPYGVTCEGSYIWYSDLKSGWVFKMKPIPYGTAVEPVSLGKVKVLYR